APSATVPFSTRRSSDLIAILELIRHIEIAYRHAETFGQIADLRADIAVTNNAQGLTAHFPAANRSLFPNAVMCLDRTRENTPHQHDDFTNHQFSDRSCVGKWRVENRNPSLARCIQLYLICSDRITTHRNETLGSLKYIIGQLGA